MPSSVHWADAQDSLLAHLLSDIEDRVLVAGPTGEVLRVVRPTDRVAEDRHDGQVGNHDPFQTREDRLDLLRRVGGGVLLEKPFRLGALEAAVRVTRSR